MKKILSVLLVGGILLLLTGCSSDNRVDQNFEPTEIEGISMLIKENTLTDRGATVVIYDTNGKGTYIYGSSFRVDKKENGEWVKPKETGQNCGFNEMAYYVNDNGILEMEQNWDCMYGSLEAGTYRLVKDISLQSDIPITDNDKKYISVEFVIE